MLQTIKKKESNHSETFFEYATIGIVITNRYGIISDINPYALNEFGYKLNELVGQKIEILIPPRFHENHSKHHVAYLEKPITRLMGQGLDLVARKKDGSEMDVEISLSSYQVNGDKYAIAFINNITSRKKAEAKIEKLNNDLELTVAQRTKDLRQTLRQLEKTKEILEKTVSNQRAIVDNAGAMIIATDIHGIIELFNPEACLNLGYTEAEMVHKKTPIIFHIKDEIKQKRKALNKEFGIRLKSYFDVMVEKSKRNIHDEEQYTYIRKDGSTFPVMLTISSIKNKAGEITGFMGISIDITERKKAEEKLRSSLEKEKDLNELKSRFVSMASHEFRTPLSTVLSSAFLIEKYKNTEDQHQRVKHLQRITTSVSMLTDILNDFLSLGKIEEGKIQVRGSSFNIEQMINSTIEEMQVSFQKKQIIIYSHKGPTEVFLDKGLLKHIIFNLVSNASKFSPEKSLIKIKTLYRNDQLVLSVKDMGMGISKADQTHLMERFFRGANAGNIQGTGLGLHIVAKYTDLMYGKVNCISELEKGTEFIITFNINNEQP